MERLSLSWKLARAFLSSNWSSGKLLYGQAVRGARMLGLLLSGQLGASDSLSSELQLGVSRLLLEDSSESDHTGTNL